MLPDPQLNLILENGATGLLLLVILLLLFLIGRVGFGSWWVSLSASFLPSCSITLYLTVASIFLRLSLIAYVMALGIVVNDDIVLISFFLRNLEAGLSLL